MGEHDHVGGVNFKPINSCHNCKPCAYVLCLLCIDRFDRILILFFSS